MNELIKTQKQIEDKIFIIRGVQVMLDRDLAEMYQVETKVLNQAVKRNIERFPIEFRFQLTENEAKNLLEAESSISRSQIVTLNDKRGQNIKYLPYAFTEQGVAMLSAILRSEIAIKVSIQIINAFVQLRKILQNNQLIYTRLDNVERKQLETDQKFEQVFKALQGNAIPTQGVFFNDQVFDAYELSSKIIRSAKSSIVLIDNYIDETTITHLTKKKKNVKVLLLTKTISKQLALDIQKANEQYAPSGRAMIGNDLTAASPLPTLYGGFTAKPFTQSHDRFLIIDEGKEVYHIGASLKDLGKKWFAFSKMDSTSVAGIMKVISGMV